MTLEIIKPGYFTQIQDFGRFGYLKYGITTGGPLDEHAYLWANRLLANHFNAPQLEISLGGMSARFSRRTMIAICGADFIVKCNNRRLSMWQSHLVNVDDLIEFQGPSAGSRCYLAIKGGFDVNLQLGSCATVQREKLGGLHQSGELLQKNDLVHYEPSQQEGSRQVPDQYIPTYSKQVNLRFIPNRTVNGCNQVCLEQFIGQSYEVTSEINRMGFRLSGEPLADASSGIISQGIALGTIQIPSDGQVIVLMRDRQTMGGYSQAGCVAYLDISILAQSLPGTEVTFTPVTLADVESELATYKEFFGVEF